MRWPCPTGSLLVVVVVAGVLDHLPAGAGAPLADLGLQRPVAGDHLGRQRADVAAVVARLHGAGVLGLALRRQREAVVQAHLALPGAVDARLEALLLLGRQLAGVVGLARLRLRAGLL